MEERPIHGSQRPEPLPVHPLSFEQESIWLNDQFQEGGSRYLESWVQWLNGAIDVAAVAAALTGLVRRHESLRSSIGMRDGEPVQTVLPPMPVPLAVRTVTSEDLDAALFAAVTRQIPLDDPPLLRATLLRLADDEAVLAVAIHHVVVDGWSVRLFDQEFGELYDRSAEGSEAHLPAVSVQLGGYAERQRRAARAGMGEHLGYWLAELRDAPPESRFPADRLRPDALGHRGGQVEFTVDAEIAGDVRRLCRELGTTPFVVLTGAFSALLVRCGGQRDVVIGAPISRRDHDDLDTLFACLTDVMPLRLRCTPDISFRGWLDVVRDALWSAIGHRDMPFAHLVRELGIKRAPGDLPVFQVVLTLEEPGPGLRMRGIRSERRHVHGGTAKFDIFLDVVPEHDGYRGYLEYSVAMFDRAGAERLAQRFRALLADAVVRPDLAIDALHLVPRQERMLLEGWGRGPLPHADRPSVHESFAAQALRTPDAPAVIHGTRVMTYRGLEERAGALAAYLDSRGGAGRCVAVSVERAFDLAVVVLGALKTGARCVPVGESRVILTRARFNGPDVPADIETVFPGELSSAAHVRLRQNVTDDEVLYIGRNGASVSHGVLADLAEWRRGYPFREPRSRTLRLSGSGAFHEFVTGWACGGAVVLAHDEPREDLERLLDLVEEQAVDRLVVSPDVLQRIADFACEELRHCDSLRTVVVSGGRLVVTPTIRRFFAALTQAVLEYQYGTDEVPVALAQRWSEQPLDWPELASIGKPIDGVVVRVLDARREPQAVGAVGEIWVGSRHVAHAVVAGTDAERQTFVADPLSGTPALLHRTGDFGRFLPDDRVCVTALGLGAHPEVPVV